MQALDRAVQDTRQPDATVARRRLSKASSNAAIKKQDDALAGA